VFAEQNEIHRLASVRHHERVSLIEPQAPRPFFLL
jgi:hypothetical protein